MRGQLRSEHGKIPMDREEEGEEPATKKGKSKIIYGILENPLNDNFDEIVPI